MILSTVRLVVPLIKLREVIEFLNGMAEQTGVETGCIHCRLYRDSQEGGIIMLEELWSDKEDLNRHLRSNEYRKLLMMMETAVETPEIRFHTIVDTTGIETIKKARMGHGEDENR
jgi:quinol monooxygenase YgiN